MKYKICPICSSIVEEPYRKVYCSDICGKVGDEYNKNPHLPDRYKNQRKPSYKHHPGTQKRAADIVMAADKCGLSYGQYMSKLEDYKKRH